MSDKKTKDLTVGNPLKLMVAYAIPVLLGNIIQQIYSFADAMIVGKSLGNNAFAAVGATGSLNFLVFGFVIGITSGFSVYVSQCFGAQDFKEMRKAVANAFFLWFLFDVILTLVSCLAMGPLLRLMNTPDVIYHDAWVFIFTICAGTTAVLLYNGMASVLRALGDSKTPLIFLVMSVILNIVLDLLFILVFHWGVFGAAFATVLAQFCAALSCVYYAYKKFPILRMSKEDLQIDGEIISKHLKIGLPMAFQFSITAIGTIILQGAVNVFGEAHITAFTAASKVEQLVTMIGPACGVTMATYVGQNMGAGRYDRIKIGVRQWSIFTVGASIVAALFVYIAGPSISLLFLKEQDPVVMEAIHIYLNAVIPFFIPLFLIFVYRNALQAMGKTFMPLMAGFFELFARSGVAFLLPSVLGFLGVCLAGPIAWIAAVVPLAITYFWHQKRFDKY